MNIFKKKSLSYEQILVADVMNRLNILISKTPFQFLAFSVTTGNADDRRIITYIIKDKIMYLDENCLITKDTDSNADFNKYCFKFNGKFKTFRELDKYEFIFANMLEFTSQYTKALELKKCIYKIK